MRALAAIPLWHARGPRFLVLLVFGWVMLRAAANWPVPPTLIAPHPALPVIAAAAGTTPSVVASTSWPAPTSPIARRLGRAATIQTPVTLPDRVGSHYRAQPPASVWTGPDRHRWRYQLLLAMMPQSRATAAALPATHVVSYFPGGAQPPPQAPLWPAALGNRWSLSAYAYWRGGGDGLPALAANRPATLGGSQSAVRIDYAIDGKQRLRAFARVTATPLGGGQADLAIGVAARAVAALPVDLYVEQRLPLAGSAPARTLVYAAGGIDDQPIAHGFRLSAYAQGGVAGPTALAGFVDGSVSVQRPVFERRGVSLSVGALLGGAAQSGARRIDIGPRATLYLPGLGQGARVALDWRERVAGNALPGSGAALTLAAGF